MKFLPKFPRHFFLISPIIQNHAHYIFGNSIEYYFENSKIKNKTPKDVIKQPQNGISKKLPKKFPKSMETIKEFLKGIVIEGVAKNIKEFS